MKRNAPGLVIVAAIAATLAACDGTGTHPTVTRDGSTVGQKMDNAVAATKEDLARAGDKVKPALDKAGEKLREATSSDAMITTSIKADYLKDPDLSVLKIDVDTVDGVVTLNGLAKDAAAKGRAEKLASGIKGVREVRNHLAIKQG